MTNPKANRKHKKIHDCSTAITASANGEAVDIRGMENIKFSFVGTTVDQTTDETYDCKIQTRNSPLDGWVDVDGCTFTQQDTNTSFGEQKPADSDAPGVVLQRYIRSVITIAGTTPSFAGYVGMSYERPALGPVVDHGAVTG